MKRPAYDGAGTTAYDDSIAVVSVGSTCGGLAILGMVVRGLMQNWTQRQALPPEDVDEVQTHVGQLTAEVSELQERLDFAERVLSRERDRDRLEAGG